MFICVPRAGGRSDTPSTRRCRRERRCRPWPSTRPDRSSRARGIGRRPPGCPAWSAAPMRGSIMCCSSTVWQSAQGSSACVDRALVLLDAAVAARALLGRLRAARDRAGRGRRRSSCAACAAADRPAGSRWAATNRTRGRRGRTPARAASGGISAFSSAACAADGAVAVLAADVAVLAAVLELELLLVALAAGRHAGVVQPASPSPVTTVAAWCGRAENSDSGRITKRSSRTIATMTPMTMPRRVTCSGSFTGRPPRTTADAHASKCGRVARAPPGRIGQDAGWFCPMLVFLPAGRSKGFVQACFGQSQRGRPCGGEAPR